MHDTDFEITDVCPAESAPRLTRDDELSAREWFSLAWRPAGARSLTDGWVRAGSADVPPKLRARPVPPPKPKLPAHRVK
jgi:hypothetical protein